MVIKLNKWRIRLVGRGRTIGNRVTGNTVLEFESLILRHEMGHRRVSFFRGGEQGSSPVRTGLRTVTEGRARPHPVGETGRAKE